MKTSLLSVKVDDQVKKQAQSVAAGFGIPLSTLVNAYLIELGQTKQIYFSAVELMTPKMEQIIGEAEKEIAAGETVGPFASAADAINFLNR